MIWLIFGVQELLLELLPYGGGCIGLLTIDHLQSQQHTIVNECLLCLHSSKCKRSESSLCPLQLTAFSYPLEVMPSTLIHLTYSCDMGIHSKEEIVLWSVAVFLQAYGTCTSRLTSVPKTTHASCFGNGLHLEHISHHMRHI